MELKPVRGPEKPQASRPIKSFDGPADGPHRNPPTGGAIPTSNATAARAVRIAQKPGSIDPTQQKF
jgi:hypothetical protein